MVTIIFNSKPTQILCHMGDFGCGDGGWTPVLKMDGNKVCNIRRRYIDFAEAKSELLRDIFVT